MMVRLTPNWRGGAQRGATRPMPRTPALRRWQSLLVPVLLLTVLLLALQIGAASLRSLTDTPVRHVQIDGDFRHLSLAGAEAVILPHLGDGFLRLDLKRIRDDLEALPWVQVATVQRRWPDRLQVLITEQVAVLRWGSDALLNPYGETFRPPSLAGFDDLPAMVGPQGSERMMLDRFDVLMELLTPHGRSVQRLELDGKHSWSLVLDDGLRVVLGRHDLTRRTRRLAMLVGSAGPGASVLAPAAVVDLRYSNGFTVAGQESG